MRWRAPRQPRPGFNNSRLSRTCWPRLNRPQRPNYGQYPNAYRHGVPRLFGQSPPSTPTQHNGTLWSDEFFLILSDVYSICVNLLIH